MTEQRTCKACRDKRLHTALEWKLFHPLAGHGLNEQRTWTHPDAEKAHNEDVEALRKKGEK